MSLVKSEKKNFIVVYHFWFMESKYFRQEKYLNMTKDEVFKEALVYKHKHESTFNRCAFEIVEI